MSISAKQLTIMAFSRDCNGFQVTDTDGNEIVDIQADYVPYGWGIGGGDSVELTIDVETGTIVGWNPEKFQAAIRERLQEEEDDEA